MIGGGCRWRAGHDGAKIDSAGRGCGRKHHGADSKGSSEAYLGLPGQLNAELTVRSILQTPNNLFAVPEVYGVSGKKRPRWFSGGAEGEERRKEDA